MIDPGTVVTAAKIAEEIVNIYKEAEERGWVEKIKKFIKEKKIILVVGTSGTGKTNFIDSIDKLVAFPVEYSARTHSVVENLKNLKDKCFYLVDTPGHIAELDKTKDYIKKHSKKIVGIINVVAYGYHEYSPMTTDKAVETDGTPKQKYLEEHRKKEINALDNWTEELGGGNLAEWVLTTVNKADLWYHDRDKVINYYASNENRYFKKLGTVQKLHRDVLPYSCVCCKFYNKSPISGYFDDNVRLDIKKRFLETFISYL